MCLPVFILPVYRRAYKRVPVTLKWPQNKADMARLSEK